MDYDATMVISGSADRVSIQVGFVWGLGWVSSFVDYYINNRLFCVDMDDDATMGYQDQQLVPGWVCVGVRVGEWIC